MNHIPGSSDIKRKKDKNQGSIPPSPSKSKMHKSSGKLFRHKDKERTTSGSSFNGASSSSSTGVIRKDEIIDIKESPLMLPDVTPLDHLKSLPRYNQLVAGESVPLEEMDGLQLELELLLSSILVRQISLSNQVAIIEQLEKGKVMPKLATSPGKRAKKDDADRPFKKFKETSGKARDVLSSPGPPPGSKHMKVKCSVVKNEPLFDVPDVAVNEPPKPPPPKNDITNRFWLLVEQYCQEITADDIKMLEEMISLHNDDSEYYKIPPLGRHYTLRWAQEDLQDEQKEGGKMSDMKKKGRENSGYDMSDKLLKEVDMNGCSDDVAPLGPLTQRVIAGLVEENVLVSENIENKGVNGVGVGRPGFMKSLGLGSASGLEKRIKKELQEQGIIDADFDKDDDDDEIQSELKRCQAELRAVSSHNNTQLTRLLRLARDALVRHDLKKKLRDCDAKVIEAYKTIAAARQKKKTPTKKDKEAAYKALKDRDSIVRHPDLMSPNL